MRETVHRPLHQHLWIELLRCVERYDHRRNSTFTSFAWNRMLGAVTDLRRRGSRVPRAALRLQKQMKEDGYAGILDVSPERIAAAYGVDVEHVKRMQQSARACYAMPLYLHSDNPALAVADPDIQHVEDEVDRRQDADVVRGHLRSLPERMRDVVTLTMFDGATLREAGERVGVTESGASRLRSQALWLLRCRLAAQA